MATTPNAWRMLTEEEAAEHFSYKSRSAVLRAIRNQEFIVTEIPYSHFKAIPYFEPYTKRDLQEEEDDPRVNRIVRGFKKKSPTIPMIIGTISRGGKIHIIDGYTRAAVAMALKKKIMALLLPISVLPR